MFAFQPVGPFIIFVITVWSNAYVCCPLLRATCLIALVVGLAFAADCGTGKFISFEL
jgi:hypothetical protein